MRILFCILLLSLAMLPTCISGGATSEGVHTNDIGQDVGSLPAQQKATDV